MTEVVGKHLLFAFALAYSFSVLVARWGTPLSSPHAFRETQTAMTVYWMVHDDGHRRDSGSGDRHAYAGIRGVSNLALVRRWINYQTPVLGPPYEIPFEFPTFQWVVAGVYYVTKIGLDNGGRLCSWLFMVASLVPLWRLAGRHRVDPWIAAVVYLCSPVYLYWGTAFLIETCSLFLCLMFLWMIGEERWVLGLTVGVLAAVTKLTTFLPFALLAVMSGGLRLSVVVNILVAGVIAVGWNHYTDLLKAQNPLSAVLMSSQPAQQLHDFGTLAQRLSGQPWDTLWQSIKGLL